MLGFFLRAPVEAGAFGMLFKALQRFVFNGIVLSITIGCSQEQQQVCVWEVHRVGLEKRHEVFPAGSAGLHLTRRTNRRGRGGTRLRNR